MIRFACMGDDVCALWFTDEELEGNSKISGSQRPQVQFHTSDMLHREQNKVFVYQLLSLL